MLNGRSTPVASTSRMTPNNSGHAEDFGWGVTEFFVGLSVFNMEIVDIKPQYTALACCGFFMFIRSILDAVLVLSSKY